MPKIDSDQTPAPASDDEVKFLPPPIHWSEKVVLAIVSIHLIYLPWALGAMHLGAQKVSLVLGGVGFLAALFLNPPSTIVVPKIPAWKKLLKSSIFWLGLVILGYIFIQAVNPSHRAVDLGGEFWMVPVDHITWLPTGMEAPFEKVNAHRRLMVFASVFLTIWTIVLFIERPKSIRFLLWVLVFNGVGLAILAFGQLFTGAEKIFWKIPSASENFYSSFIYRNHATGYLNLLLACSTGLYFFFRERAWKTNESEPDKSPIFFFTSTILFTTVLFSGSRGGIIVAALLLLLAILYTMLQAWRWDRLRETSVISAILLGMLVLFASVFTVMIGPERIIERFKHFTEDGGGTSVEHRILAAKATRDMFEDKWLYGWGAGSFEYVFPAYQSEYPEIDYREVGRNKRRIYFTWEFAHNDWVQYPAEYGVVGTGLFFAGIIGWLIGLFRFRGLRRPLAVWMGIGILATFGHAVGEFVLQNPAIILTTASFFALSYRYVELENLRRIRRKR
ncbi:MAG TPA: O-antigen ligase family protein [Opitutales bacterium]|nr:O-antigen ligase family protein [Opitutales bacterium]